MIYKLIQLLLFVFSLVIVFSSEMTNFELADYHFYLLIGIAITELAKTKSISLLFVWIMGFVFIILSEVLTVNSFEGDSISITFLLVANDVLLISYLIAGSKKGFWILQKLPPPSKQQVYIINRKRYIFSIVILYGLYTYEGISAAVDNLLYGRQLVSTEGSGNVYGFMINAIPIILPSIIAYYVVYVKKKNFLYALLFVLPLFILLLLGATRYKLLFSVVPFCLTAGILQFKKLTIKSFSTIILFAGLLVFLSSWVKNTRNRTFDERMEIFQDQKEDHEYSAISAKVLSYGSPEGIVNMTHLANEYFSLNDLRYGECTGFLSYFWIPRSIWANKPTMLDHWLPLYYDPTLSEAYSSSSGFTGSLRADFGQEITICFMIIIGILMRRLDNELRKMNYGNTSNILSLFYVIFVPYVFFSVRSPITATFTLDAELIILYVIYKFCCKKKILNKYESN